MAGLILSPVIDFVKQRVVAYLEDRIDLHTDVEEKLKKLERVLNQIQPVANTAEEVDLEKHNDLKPWMCDLKFVVEEAKDVADEFEYLRLKRQAEGNGVDDEVGSSSKRLKGIAGRVSIPSFFNYGKTSTDSLEKLKERLRDIQSKLEELNSQAGQLLQLVELRMATDREHQIQDFRKRETSSSVVERDLVGRRKEMLEEIIRKLLQEEEEHISVIAVVGHGGMGKTTLAQNIFNDTRMEPHFQVRMWAHVSQVFDVSTLTKKILESATRTESSDSSLETLQQKLKDVLKSKRFLLVLDDVWYNQPNRPFAMEEEWKKLCSPLSEACGKGSKILLTSRTPEVNKLSTGAPLMTTLYLEELAPEECWSIMQTMSAFNASGIPDDCRGRLVAIGRQIATKVKGSPLAAKAVGGILRNKLSPEHWSSILDKELSKLLGNDLMPVLRLSYRYLPSYLRQCFAYCSLFPKGHIFSVHKLVRMWVAIGYIQDRPYRDMTEEDIGRSYFDDLLSAGFFTSQEVYGRQKTVMHDLMNDLAQSITRDEILRIEEDIQYCSIPKTVRHLSVTFDYLAEFSKNMYNNLSHLESFLLLPRIDRGVNSVVLDKKLVKEVLQQLRCVRVLDLNYFMVEDLPDDISHWVHLRYLDISTTNISRLPDSLMILYHLQVLFIQQFYEIYHSDLLLKKLNNLVNLRYLSIGTNIFLNLTCIRGLKSLQEVKGYLHVEERRGSEIMNLKDLNDLRGALLLNNLRYIESGAAAREAELCRKNRLQELILKWGGECSPELATEVLQALQPPKSLEELYIDSYPGIVCPSWMSIPVLENLASIELSNLFHLECIPPLGQQLPFLQRLRLEELPKVRKLSLEGFPSLKYLTIASMEELEEWSGPDGSRGLSCLESFSITTCPKMRMLPTLSHTVPFLRYLNLQGLPRVRKLSLEGFPSLKYLTIVSMEELEEWSGPDGSGGLPCLEEFKITKCPKVRMLPTLSNTVTELSIDNVGISTLPGLVVNQGIITNSGSSSSSSGITSFSSKLSKLKIRNCGNLTSLGEGLLQNQQRLTHLKLVIVRNCELLVSLPHGGFQELKSLTGLKIVYCPNLTWAAPREGVDRGLLPSSLEDLRISHIDDNALSRCLQGLSRLSKQLTYLTSLQILYIYSCQSLTPSALEEGLHALPSLTMLFIEDCPGLLVETSSISAADDSEGMAIGPPCPLALQFLEIDDPQMLVNVPVLKSLTSVEDVCITDASRLISFSPELEEWLLQNGTSLTCVTMRKARQLQSLPKLPDSLEQLYIWGADREFKKRYERDTGCDWYKIRHIAYVIN